MSMNAPRVNAWSTDSPGRRKSRRSTATGHRLVPSALWSPDARQAITAGSVAGSMRRWSKRQSDVWTKSHGARVCAGQRLSIPLARSSRGWDIRTFLPGRCHVSAPRWVCMSWPTIWNAWWQSWVQNLWWRQCGLEALFAAEKTRQIGFRYRY